MAFVFLVYIYDLFDKLTMSCCFFLDIFNWFVNIRPTALLKHTYTLARFLIQCLKTKTKVISLANHKNVNNTMEQSELEANAGNGKTR